MLFTLAAIEQNTRMVLSWAGSLAVGAFHVLATSLEKRAGILAVAITGGCFTALMSTDSCMWQCCREKYLKELAVHTILNSSVRLAFGLVIRKTSGDEKMPAVKQRVPITHESTTVKSGAYHITTFT